MSSTLRRHILAFMLVVVTLVWAVPSSVQPSTRGLEHSLVHLQLVSHHHHVDEALHLDDTTPGELSHSHASDGAKPLAWPVLALSDPAKLPHVLVPSDGPFSLAVVLKGPSRPPAALLA